MRRYAFTLMLSISIVVVGLVSGPPHLWAKDMAYAGAEPDRQAHRMDKPDRKVPETQGAAIREEESEQVSEQVSDSSVENFEDTLFIGDSRTVGLKEYADLGEADVFASSGMNIFKIFDTQISVKEKGSMTLEKLLTSKEYKRIYLMLGINELGYGFSRSSGKYREVVERIQLLQPQAVVYLEANLHVTKHKSDSDPIFNNDGIDKFNQYIKDMTDGSSLVYLDVNPLFDDGTGSLASEYTADDSHVLGKYYSVWAEWIKGKSR